VWRGCCRSLSATGLPAQHQVGLADQALLIEGHDNSEEGRAITGLGTAISGVPWMLGIQAALAGAQ